MPSLKIPKQDIVILAALSNIPDSEFATIVDSIAPDTIYDIDEISSNAKFDGEFSNGLQISDALLVLKRATRSAISYLMSADDLKRDIMESAAIHEVEIESDDLSYKVESSYSKFLGSGKAEDLIAYDTNSITSFQVLDNIKPVFTDDDSVMGYVFGTTIRFMYTNDGIDQSIAINIKHDDLDFLLFSIESALKRKSALYKTYKSRGDRVFTSPEEGEFYDSN